MLIVFFAKTIILLLLPTASKLAPVCIIRFILTTINNEQYPCKLIRVDEYDALEKSTDFTNLLVEEFKISIKTTDGDASWLNGKNAIHNRSIQNILRSGLLHSNKHANKLCYAVET